MSPHAFLLRKSFGLPIAVLLGLFTACAPATGPEQPSPDNRTSDRADRKVTAEDIHRTPSVPLEQLLMGKVPGIIASRTADGGISIRVRGGSSISGSNEPLFVIDGMPVQLGPDGSLGLLRLHDIESVEVLKDAVSTSMYGVRGANGVIVIKTRQAGR